MSIVLNIIKESLKDNKLIIGRNKSLKALKNGKINRLILAINAPKTLQEQVGHLCTVGGVEIMTFEGSNLELGSVCRKPFGIMVLGIKK